MYLALGDLLDLYGLLCNNSYGGDGHLRFSLKRSFGGVWRRNFLFLNHFLFGLSVFHFLFLVEVAALMD